MDRRTRPRSGRGSRLRGTGRRGAGRRRGRSVAGVESDPDALGEPVEMVEDRGLVGRRPAMAGDHERCRREVDVVIRMGNQPREPGACRDPRLVDPIASLGHRRILARSANALLVIGTRIVYGGPMDEPTTAGHPGAEEATVAQLGWRGPGDRRHPRRLRLPGLPRLEADRGARPGGQARARPDRRRRRPRQRRLSARRASARGRHRATGSRPAQASQHLTRGLEPLARARPAWGRLSQSLLDCSEIRVDDARRDHDPISRARPRAAPSGSGGPARSDHRAAGHRRGRRPVRRVRVIDLLARLERGRPVRLADIVDRLNATYLDWLFSAAVVVDVALALQANWMADYRNSSGIVLEDGPSGRRSTIEDSQPGRSVDRPPGPARGRRVYRAAGRVQPPRPTGRVAPMRRAREPRPLIVARDLERARPSRIASDQPDPEESSHDVTGYATRTPSSTPTGRRPTSTTRPSASSRSTSTRPPTSRATSPARSAGTGRASWPTGSAATSPAARTSASSCRESRHRPGHDDRPVRRQQQLVRRVGVLAAEAVRPPRRPHPQRRAQVLARQGPAADVDVPTLRGHRLRAARARLRPARLPRRHPAAPRRPDARARRRPSPGRVQRRDHRASGHERDRPARRPHPGRRVDPVGADGQGGRHVQGRPRTSRRCTRPRA